MSGERKRLLSPPCFDLEKFEFHQQSLSIFATSMAADVDLSSLEAVSVLGRGAKGVVFLVRHAAEPVEILTLKAISRSSIEKKAVYSQMTNEDPYRRIWLERDVLSSLRHPLLPSLRGFVSTDKIVGFVMDYCTGGNLTALRKRQTEQMFSDEIIGFYAAEMVLALEHLHQNRIVYRDLKPENVLIQESGHIILVDFDLSVKLPGSSRSDPLPELDTHLIRRQGSRGHRRILSCFSFNSGVSPEMSVSTRSSPEPPVLGKSNSFVGTEEYLAPEIIRGNGHDYAVDWWSLGVVLYEMLYGRTPFCGQNRKETFYRILNKEAELVGEKTALRDLIGRLLEKEAEKRIGVEEIKRHEFFTGVDWEEVLTVERTPFIPGGVDWEEFRGMAGIDVERCVEEMMFGVGEKKRVEEEEEEEEKGGDFGVF